MFKGLTGTSLKTIIGVLILINIILLCGLGALLYFMSQKVRNVATLSAALNQTLGEELQQKELNTLLEETLVERGKLSLYFIHTEEVVDLLKTLEGLGEKAGVKSTITSVNPRTEQDQSEVLTVEIDALGEFNHVLHFLSLIEHIPLRVELKRFSLERKELTTLADSKKAKAGIREWQGNFVIQVLSFSK